MLKNCDQSVYFSFSLEEHLENTVDKQASIEEYIHVFRMWITLDLKTKPNRANIDYYELYNHHIAEL